MGSIARRLGLQVATLAGIICLGSMAPESVQALRFIGRDIPVGCPVGQSLCDIGLGALVDNVATVKVTDSSGVEVQNRTFFIPSGQAQFQYFGVASEGYNDNRDGSGGFNPPGSRGLFWVDNLSADWIWIFHVPLAFQDFSDFSTVPPIDESTHPSTLDAMRWDESEERLHAVGNSSYAIPTWASTPQSNCTFSNYEAIAIAPGTDGLSWIYHAEFDFGLHSRTGDSSFWNLYLGLFPSLDDVPSDANCSSGPSGNFDSLLGLRVRGDGTGLRATFSAWWSDQNGLPLPPPLSILGETAFTASGTYHATIDIVMIA